MPNAALETDRDGNGRPDGWLGCKFASSVVGPAGKPAMAIAGPAAQTTLYGPQPGHNRLSFAARCAGDKPGPLTVDVQAVAVGKDLLDQPPTSLARQTATVGKDWQTVSIDLEIAPETDRLSIRISSGAAENLIANPSFRRLSP
jgi:hypothetical protein